MTARLRSERGFVLSVVIFAVAALSIAGTALFLVVQSENAMANSGASSSSALHLANAGLSRYMGETFGTPRASVTYQMGGGSVTVTSERIMPIGDSAVMYLVRSRAELADRRVPDLVSRRTVQQFARLRRRPFNPVAALTLATGSVQTHAQTVLDGTDGCGVGTSIGGIATLGPRPAGGSISSHIRYNSQTALVSALGADWEALTDSAFAYDYQDAWPSSGFAMASPADSFPTVRFSTDVSVSGSAPPSGRGLLVVDGHLTIDTYTVPWTWDGVIVAGSVDFRSNAMVSVRGAILTGLEGTQAPIGSNAMKNVSVRYNSCNVMAAAEGVATLSPMPNTWWESPL